jgi:hypothetical protein
LLGERDSRGYNEINIGRQGMCTDLLEKCLGKPPLGSSKRRWEYIKTSLKKIGFIRGR